MQATIVNECWNEMVNDPKKIAEEVLEETNEKIYLVVE